MTQDRAIVSRMLENYRELIGRFVHSEMSADAFETQFMNRFTSDIHQVVGDEFDVLDGLFADVDDYVADPGLRAQTSGISGEELRARARDVYFRLYGERA